MTDEDVHPHAPPRGGFAGGARKKAADDILTAQQAVAAELPITLRWPSAIERSQGIAALFEYEDGQLKIEGHASRGDRGLVITRVQVASPLPGGVTHQILRDAPLAGILKAIRTYAMHDRARREGTHVIVGQESAAGLFAPGDVKIPKTSGRTELTDELLRAVALAFIEETGPGKDRRAIQRMAKRFERPEGTVRAWIARARKDGWLAPGSKGRIGAEAGRRLIKWDLDEGIDEIEPPGGAPTGGDRVGVKRGTEAQLAEYNQRLAGWERLPDSDPRLAEWERELDWRKSGDDA